MSKKISTTSGLANAQILDDKPLQHFDYQPLLSSIRKSFNSRKTLNIKWRMDQLRALEKVMDENSDAIIAAVQADLGRPDTEALLGDVSPIYEEVRYAISNLEKWTKPEQVATPLTLKPSKSFIVREPKGVTLIIGAWNFPFNLVFLPLIGAIAAGCCAIVKPSEVSVNCAKLIQELIEKYLDPDCFKVVCGGVPETTALLKLPYDHIFYTGNGFVGRIILKAAAEHLTPVTLELGGKSPVIVDKDANISLAAKRILHGKFFNAGQICVSPDYILCHKDIEQKLTAEILQNVKKMFGENPIESKSYGRIVNKRHWKRVTSLIQEADGEVIYGGVDGAIEEKKYIPPTIIKGVDRNNRLMKEEIFGPVLPILSVDNTDEAVEFVNQRDKPLALYVFSSNWKNAGKIINLTSAGGSCVNDVVMHLSPTSLPFGGVGPSGMGKYHGIHSFHEFSHHRSVLYSANWSAASSDGRYPPYKLDVATLKKLIIGPLFPKYVTYGLQSGVVVLLAIILYFVVNFFFSSMSG